MLRDLCDGLQTQAHERNLYLKAEGPDSLIVDGDAVKVRRIAQNLLINALRYTHVGGVTVSWGDSKENDAERWMFSVQDTGPGFHSGPGAPLVSALKAATIASHDIDRKAGVDPEAADENASAIDDDQREVGQQRGEGVGLSIVKRLSDLLNATIELESSAELGTDFQSDTAAPLSAGAAAMNRLLTPLIAARFEQHRVALQRHMTPGCNRAALRFYRARSLRSIWPAATNLQRSMRRSSPIESGPRALV